MVHGTDEGFCSNEAGLPVGQAEGRFSKADCRSQTGRVRRGSRRRASQRAMEPRAPVRVVTGRPGTADGTWGRLELLGGRHVVPDHKARGAGDSLTTHWETMGFPRNTTEMSQGRASGRGQKLKEVPYCVMSTADAEGRTPRQPVQPRGSTEESSWATRKAHTNDSR